MGSYLLLALFTTPVLLNGIGITAVGFEMPCGNSPLLIFYGSVITVRLSFWTNSQPKPKGRSEEEMMDVYSFEMLE